MNLFLFIALFLLVMTNYFLAIQHRFRTNFYQIQLYLNEGKARRRAQAKAQHTFYKKRTQGEEEPRTRSKKDREEVITQIPSHPREFKKSSQWHKVNLYPLLQCDDLQNSYLYAISCRLVQILYSHCDLYTSGFEQTFLHKLIQQGKKQLAKNSPNGEVSLIDLQPEDPLEAQLSYQLMRGTNQYDIQSQKGIPPLGDFFTCYEDKSEALYFRYLRREILEAIFSTPLTERIWNEEMQKRREGKAQNKPKESAILTDSELKNAMHAERISFDPALYKLIQFDKKAVYEGKEAVVEGEDPTNTIRVQVRL